MNSLTIKLPWPSADLSPNSRNKWAMIKAKKAAKADAWGMAQSLMGPLGIARGSWVGPISVQYTFHPAMIRGRDDDNFAARMKSARDGIALALGVDDVKFSQQPVVFGETRKAAPCVIVTLTPAAIKVPFRGPIS